MTDARVTCCFILATCLTVVPGILGFDLNHSHSSLRFQGGENPSIGSSFEVKPFHRPPTTNIPLPFNFLFGIKPSKRGISETKEKNVDIIHKNSEYEDQEKKYIGLTYSSRTVDGETDHLLSKSDDATLDDAEEVEDSIDIIYKPKKGMSLLKLKELHQAALNESENDTITSDESAEDNKMGIASSETVNNDPDDDLKIVYKTTTEFSKDILKNKHMQSQMIEMETETGDSIDSGMDSSESGDSSSSSVDSSSSSVDSSSSSGDSSSSSGDSSSSSVDSSSSSGDSSSSSGDSSSSSVDSSSSSGDSSSSSVDSSSSSAGSSSSSAGSSSSGGDSSSSSVDSSSSSAGSSSSSAGSSSSSGDSSSSSVDSSSSSVDSSSSSAGSSSSSADSSSSSFDSSSSSAGSSSSSADSSSESVDSSSSSTSSSSSSGDSSSSSVGSSSSSIDSSSSSVDGSSSSAGSSSSSGDSTSSSVGSSSSSVDSSSSSGDSSSSSSDSSSSSGDSSSSSVDGSSSSAGSSSSSGDSTSSSVDSSSSSGDSSSSSGDSSSSSSDSSSSSGDSSSSSGDSSSSSGDSSSSSGDSSSSSVGSSSSSGDSSSSSGDSSSSSIGSSSSSGDSSSSSVDSSSSSVDGSSSSVDGSSPSVDGSSSSVDGSSSSVDGSSSSAGSSSSYVDDSSSSGGSSSSSGDSSSSSGDSSSSSVGSSSSSVGSSSSTVDSSSSSGDSSSSSVGSSSSTGDSSSSSGDSSFSGADSSSSSVDSSSSSGDSSSSSVGSSSSTGDSSSSGADSSSSSVDSSSSSGDSSSSSGDSSSSSGDSSSSSGDSSSSTSDSSSSSVDSSSTSVGGSSSSIGSSSSSDDSSSTSGDSSSSYGDSSSSSGDSPSTSGDSSSTSGDSSSSNGDSSSSSGDSSSSSVDSSSSSVDSSSSSVDSSSSSVDSSSSSVDSSSSSDGSSSSSSLSGDDDSSTSTDGVSEEEQEEEEGVSESYSSVESTMDSDNTPPEVEQTMPPPVVDDALNELEFSYKSTTEFSYSKLKDKFGKLTTPAPSTEGSESHESTTDHETATGIPIIFPENPDTDHETATGIPIVFPENPNDSDSKIAYNEVTTNSYVATTEFDFKAWQDKFQEILMNASKISSATEMGMIDSDDLDGTDNLSEGSISNDLEETNENTSTNTPDEIEIPTTTVTVDSESETESPVDDIDSDVNPDSEESFTENDETESSTIDLDNEVFTFSPEIVYKSTTEFSASYVKEKFKNETELHPSESSSENLNSDETTDETSEQTTIEPNLNDIMYKSTTEFSFDYLKKKHAVQQETSDFGKENQYPSPSYYNSENLFSYTKPDMDTSQSQYTDFSINPYNNYLDRNSYLSLMDNNQNNYYSDDHKISSVDNVLNKYLTLSDIEDSNKVIAHISELQSELDNSESTPDVYTYYDSRINLSDMSYFASRDIYGRSTTLKEPLMKLLNSNNHITKGNERVDGKAENSKLTTKPMSKAPINSIADSQENELYDDVKEYNSDESSTSLKNSSSHNSKDELKYALKQITPELSHLQHQDEPSTVEQLPESDMMLNELEENDKLSTFTQLPQSELMLSDIEVNTEQDLIDIDYDQITEQGDLIISSINNNNVLKDDSSNIIQFWEKYQIRLNDLIEKQEEKMNKTLTEGGEIFLSNNSDNVEVIVVLRENLLSSDLVQPVRAIQYDMKCADPKVIFTCGSCASVIMCMEGKAHLYDCQFPSMSCYEDEKFASAVCRATPSPKCSCDDSETYKADPYDYNSYIRCEPIMSHFNCESHEEFLEKENRCRSTPISPPCTALGIFPNLNDCRWYQECRWSNELGNFDQRYHRCPSNYMYSIAHGKCVHHFDLPIGDLCILPDDDTRDDSFEYVDDDYLQEGDYPVDNDYYSLTLSDLIRDDANGNITLNNLGLSDNFTIELIDENFTYTSEELELIKEATDLRSILEASADDQGEAKDFEEESLTNTSAFTALQIESINRLIANEIQSAEQLIAEELKSAENFADEEIATVEEDQQNGEIIDPATFNEDEIVNVIQPNATVNEEETTEETLFENVESGYTENIETPVTENIENELNEILESGGTEDVDAAEFISNFTSVEVQADNNNDPTDPPNNQDDLTPETDQLIRAENNLVEDDEGGEVISESLEESVADDSPFSIAKTVPKKSYTCRLPVYPLVYLIPAAADYVCSVMNSS